MSNPLISSQKSSELQTVLHPLVLLTISDYITRHTLRQQSGPIVGALLGQQNGREITIEHAFECHTRAAPDVDGGYLLDADNFSARLEQMTIVHKDRNLDFVGWYTLLPPFGPTPTILPIHSQILQGWNESALLLGFHPEEVMQHSVGGKLPLTIYESNYEVDDGDGEDKKMDEGTLRLRFREIPYSVETDETEMISMNYVAGSSGAAVPARSVESTGKGKRRLVEADGESTDDVDLSREEEELVAALTAKANAIKMLHSRIRLLITYLEGLEEKTTPSFPILRQIQALVSRLDLVIPSDAEAFKKEVQQETNDVHLIELLNGVMQSVTQAREVGRKVHIVETKAAQKRPGGPDYMASPGLAADYML